MPHALLSPSSSHRWLNCTAAPLIEAKLPDSSSSFAEEGSLAHAFCARHLKQYLGLTHEEEDKEIAELSSKYYSGEMDEFTDTYRQIVVDKFESARSRISDSQLLVEVRLDFTNWVPESFGTSDAIIISDGVLEVIDFKYGKGVKVSAERNPQMMIYALGAFEKFSFEYDIHTIRMTIVQPRISNLSTYELSVGELLQWSESELRPKASLAMSGKGETEPGDWCKFCKARATCRALADFATAEMGDAPESNLLSPDEIAALLPKIAIIKAWASDVEAYALGLAMAGTSLQGFKLVAGRSVRKIVNQEGASAALTQNGFSPDDFIKPRELRTITELERLVGKKRFAEICGEFIDKPAGKPTLVPADDKREAIDPVANDFSTVE